MAGNIREFFSNLFRRKEYEDDEEEDDLNREEEEQRAMRKFRQNIAKYRFRNTNVTKAPLFDYVEWKQMNCVRSPEGSPDEYILQASALAPYVRTTLHTGCVGEEERRWAKLTGVAHEESLAKSAHAQNMTRLSARLRASRSSRNKLF